MPDTHTDTAHHLAATAGAEAHADARHHLVTTAGAEAHADGARHHDATTAGAEARADGARHHLVTTPGAEIHVAEQGDGPLVLLIHGFGDGHRSWRHQLPALAAAGYRAAAIDVRGYGRSSAPADPAAYRVLDLVADNLAVVRALGHATAAVAGHDLGAPVAAASALLRPDVFTAVALLGVPYTPPGGPRPTEAFAAIGGEQDFYVSYFQRPGAAEAEIEPDVRGWLAGFATAVDGDGSVFFVPPGGRMRDRFPADARPPAWLAEDDLAAVAQELERSGVTGALNRYRALDRDWEDLAAWRGEPIRQHSLFVAGARDPSVGWLADAIEAHATTLPGLAGTHVLDGAGHWVHRERPEAVNALLADWLSSAP